jgi:D-alanyl-D-alanine endopeptidase (penicillin-binding protein 7)
MTALVVIEAQQPLDETLTITQDDVDTERHSSSRLRVGTQLSRGEMMHLALMSSENRAANALGRHYPGGLCHEPQGAGLGHVRYALCRAHWPLE